MTTPTPEIPRVLARFYWDCGRMGSLEGLFVTTREALAGAYGQHVEFGEVLGKHSDISGVLEEKDITIVTEDQDFIGKLVEYVGEDVSGYNPLSYLNGDE